jgi:phosphoglycolate phosphatase
MFDFDLTLADSTAGFDASHRFAAERLGLPLPDHEFVRRTIGTPLPLAVPMLYGAAVNGRLDEYIGLYQARADEVMTGLTVMLPGASEAVRRLRQAGLPLAIVSQKLRYRVEDVLRREALLDYFAVVLGGEDVPAFKPDPSGLLLALERLDVPALDALYVGDTTIDAKPPPTPACASPCSPALRQATTAPTPLPLDVAICRPLASVSLLVLIATRNQPSRFA